jgi:hypothetical protein
MDGLADLTVTAWIKTTDTGQQAILSGANSANSNDFLLFLLSPTQIAFYTGETGNSNVSWTIPSIADGAWHHLALVRNDANNQAILYLDGVSQGSRNTPLNTLTVASGGLIVGQEQDSLGGGFDPNQALNGTLDDLRLHSRTLTPQEIANLANPPE